MNLVSGNMKVLKFSVDDVSSPLGATYTTWKRGWYLCMEFNISCGRNGVNEFHYDALLNNNNKMMMI